MKKIITYIALLFVVSSSIAQDTTANPVDTLINPSGGSIEVDEVEVIKTFEAELIDAKKVSLVPEVPTVEKADRNYSYEVTIVPVKIPYPDPAIRPLAMIPDDLPISKSFYAKLGYGTFNAPYADVSYQGIKNDEFDYLISGHYYGADDASIIKQRQFYESDLTLSGGYRINENNRVTVSLMGGYDNRYNYDTLFVNNFGGSLSTLKRNVLSFQSNFGFKNIETNDAGLDYYTNLKTQYIDVDQSLKANEFGVAIDFGVKKILNDNFDLVFNVSSEFSSIKNIGFDRVGRKMITLLPGLAYHRGNLTMALNGDVIIDDQKVHAFADVEIGYALLNQSVQIFIGADQKSFSNSLWNIYNDNPFVTTLLNVKNNTISNQFYVGARGAIKSFVTYNATIGYEDVEDEGFYENRDQYLHVIYDDMTNIFLNADIEFNISDVLKIGGNIVHNIFTPQKLGFAINKPAFRYNAYTKVSLLNNKFKIKADIDFADRISFYNNADQRIKGNNMFDISAEIDYYPIENFGLWIRANNILDIEYIRYAGYPGFGRNFQGGVLINF
ncbi:MAG: hypothetical protein V3V14_07460 [Saprospiraceae bacterium]